ncbi:MAG TPA: hypothetical protein VLH08_09005 [Acidobacteriota bacterium]|nr:hypothetical protein [Acidobacteriota bacterium]
MGRLTLIFLLLVFVHPAFGWHTNTHLNITRDAISVMPPELKQKFEANPKFVEAGIRDPDELIKDFQNHYYIPGTKEGGALDRIDKIIRTIEMKMKDPGNIDAAKHFCLLAHYIADLWSPESLIKRDTMSNQDYMQNHDIIAVFEGYQKPIANYREYLEARSAWRWKLENSEAISSLLYSEAVNDIALIWLSLWQQSGHTVEPMQASIIDHTQGALVVNFEAAMKQEALDTANTASKFQAAFDEKEREQMYLKLLGHKQETERLSETLTPADESLATQRMMRDQARLESFKNPKPEFSVLESSIKPVGDGSFFVARIKNKGQKAVDYLSLIYSGRAGTLAEINNFKPGQIVKVEVMLPANASKENIRFNFSLAE